MTTFITTQQIQDQWARLKRVNQQAGRWFGASEHIDERGGLNSYPMALGVRVVMVGASGALLWLMLLIITSLGNPLYSGVAQIGYGLSILLIANYLYPRSPAAQLGLLPILGATPPIAFVLIAFGFRSVDVFAAVYPIIGISWGMLVAVELCEAVGGIFLKSFTEDDQLTPSDILRQIRNKGLLFIEERSILKEYVKSELKAMLFLWGFVVLALAGAAARTPIGWFAAIIGLAGAGYCWWIFSLTYNKEKAFVLRIIERAKADGFVEELPKPRFTLAQLIGLEKRPE